LFAFLLLLTSAPLTAAEPNAAEIAVARRLYSEAVAFEEAGKWAEAEAKLREAIGIKETPGLRYHLAVTEEKQGKLVEALVDYDRAEEMIQRGTPARDVEQLLGAARESVKKRIPTLTVNPPAAAEGVTLTIDGKAFNRALLGTAIPLNPGEHQITLTAKRVKPFETRLALAESDAKNLEISFERADAAAGSGAGAGAADDSVDLGAESSTEGGPSARTAVLIGGLALTAVGLGAGIGFTVYAGDRDDQARTAYDDVSTRNPDPDACETDTSVEVQSACSQLDEFIEQRDQARTFATIGFIAAGVGAVATVATYFLWKPSAREQQAHVQVAPLAGGALLGVGGSF
jgi:hypothetical protein